MHIALCDECLLHLFELFGSRTVILPYLFTENLGLDKAKIAELKI